MTARWGGAAGGIRALVVLLAATFALAALLVLEARDRAARQRATAAQSLQDVAAYAAWSAARAGEASLHLALSTVFQRLSGRVANGEPLLPPLSFVLRGADEARVCRCAPIIEARGYFRMDLRSGSIQGEAPAWVTDSISAAARRYLFPYALAFNGPDVAAWTLRRDDRGVVVGAYGLVTSWESMVRSLLPRIFEARKGIMPFSLRGESAIDSIVLVSLLAPGQPQPAFLAATGDTATLAPWTGGVSVAVALRPEAARLLRRDLGGPSRVPVWASLLALMIGLSAVIVLHIRREQGAARRRAEITTGMAHELRTPLAQILLYGETLLMGRARTPRESTSAAEIIVRESRRLMTLVENALHIARSGQPVRQTRETQPLAPIVREVLAGFAPIGAAAGATIDAHLDDDATATVDRFAVSQILINLLDNAVKHGPKGQRIVVRLVGSGNTVRLEVEDQGPGVPAGARVRLWEPFERGTAPGATGSGIGLSVVRELTESHAGRAWVTDGDRGARFIVELPRAEQSA